MSFHDQRKISITKDRMCSGCIAMVLKGSEMLYMVGKHYDFYALYICGKCEEFMDAHPGYFEDGWYEGDIGTAIEEEGWVPSGNS